MTIGEKIKFIRTFRCMTQKDLGIAIGLAPKGADNRMAQYETNYRVPKREMLIDIAKALDVNPLNFISDIPGSAEDIMQTFFWMDVDNPDALHFFPLTASKKKYGTGSSIKAQYDDNDTMPSVAPVGMWFQYNTVNQFLHEWMIHKEELAKGEISHDEYLEWKLNWPDTCCEIGASYRPCEPKYKWKKPDSENES
jgi:transcriptional regulator with XRE-family HTH domain